MFAHFTLDNLRILLWRHSSKIPRSCLGCVNQAGRLNNISPGNTDWNTGFSPIPDLNKGCSLLTVRKPNILQGECSSVRLYTNIFIGTSVLNCQTLTTLFLQILLTKMIFSSKLGGVYFLSPTCGQKISLYHQILLPKQCL